MDTINKIRRDSKSINSINQLAKKHKCSWATAKKLVISNPQELSKRGTRKRKKVITTNEVKSRIIQILEDDEKNRVHKKQCHKSPAILKKLKEEKLYEGSARQIRRIIKEIRDELKLKNKDRFLQLNFSTGEYLQVDHGEATVELNGHRVQGYLFVAAIPGHSLRFCQFFLTKSQETWGEFHRRVFSFYRGVFKYCIYDNDSVLKNAKTHLQTNFLDEMEKHFGFEAIFCNVASGWEKGAVENAVNYCRSNFLPGIPNYESIYSLNNFLKAESAMDRDKLHYRTNLKASDSLPEIYKNLLPLPVDYEWSKVVMCKVNSLQLIRIENYQYSVPERFVGAILKCFVSVEKIKIFLDSELIYTHDRIYYGHSDILILDHYLEQLSIKPNAFKYSKVVQLATFSEDLKNVKDILFSRMGDALGAKEFVQVLLLKRVSTSETFNLAIKLALSYGGVTSNAVSAIIKQLEIKSSIETGSKEMLPEHLLVHRQGDYELNVYQELIPEGGF